MLTQLKVSKYGMATGDCSIVDEFIAQAIAHVYRSIVAPLGMNVAIAPP